MRDHNGRNPCSLNNCCVSGQEIDADYILVSISDPYRRATDLPTRIAVVTGGNMDTLPAVKSNCVYHTPRGNLSRRWCFLNGGCRYVIRSWQLGNRPFRSLMLTIKSVTTSFDVIVHRPECFTSRIFFRDNTKKFGGFFQKKFQRRRSREFSDSGDVILCGAIASADRTASLLLEIRRASTVRRAPHHRQCPTVPPAIARPHAKFPTPVRHRDVPR